MLAAARSPPLPSSAARPPARQARRRHGGLTTLVRTAALAALRDEWRRQAPPRGACPDSLGRAAGGRRGAPGDCQRTPVCCTRRPERAVQSHADAVAQNGPERALRSDDTATVRRKQPAHLQRQPRPAARRPPRRARPGQARPGRRRPRRRRQRPAARRRRLTAGRRRRRQSRLQGSAALSGFHFCISQQARAHPSTAALDGVGARSCPQRSMTRQSVGTVEPACPAAARRINQATNLSLDAVAAPIAAMTYGWPQANRLRTAIVIIEVATAVVHARFERRAHHAISRPAAAVAGSRTERGARLGLERLAGPPRAARAPPLRLLLAARRRSARAQHIPANACERTSGPASMPMH